MQPQQLVPLQPIVDTTPPATDVSPDDWVTAPGTATPAPTQHAHHHHGDTPATPPPPTTPPPDPSMATTRHGVIPIAHDEDFEN